VASIVVGLWGPRLGRTVSHGLCILGVAASFVASIVVTRDVQAGHVFNGDVYAWLVSGNLKLAIGFLIDPLTATMLLVLWRHRINQREFDSLHLIGIDKPMH
jgi:NADH-quinone oxidoreductase subunit L